jgi:hypothetical protein
LGPIAASEWRAAAGIGGCLRLFSSRGRCEAGSWLAGNGVWWGSWAGRVLAEFVEEIFEATECVAGEVWIWGVAGVCGRHGFGGRRAIGARDRTGLWGRAWRSAGAWWGVGLGCGCGCGCGCGLCVGVGVGHRPDLRFGWFRGVRLIERGRLSGRTGDGCAIFGGWREQSIAAELFEEFAE